MKTIKLFLLLLSLFSLSLSSEARKIRFRVDMTGVPVSPNGISIAGNFRNVNYDSLDENPSLINWQPGTYFLTNGGSGNIYSVILDLAPNLAYEYKFVNDNNWAGVEGVPSVCSVSGSNNNRWTYAPSGSDTLNLPAIQFGQAAPIGKVYVGLSVDAKGITVHPSGMMVSGTFNLWAQSPIHNYVGDGLFSGSIYRTQLLLDSGMEEKYKFLNGPSGYEQVSLNCTSGFFGDRVLNVDANKNIPTVCFEKCVSCTYPIVDVTTVQFTSNSKLTSNPIIDSPDYVSPTFVNTQFRDTVIVEGIVAFNPRHYALSASSRKASIIQKLGGGPWSGVILNADPTGYGVNLSAFLTETQLYAKTANRGRHIRAVGLVRAFTNESQINLIRNGIDSAITYYDNQVEAALTYSKIPISQLNIGSVNATSMQKASGEQWEGVLVQLDSVTVDSVWASGASRFGWRVRDVNNNIIEISDYSGFYRNDNNEDSAIANTYSPPKAGTQLLYIRGMVREIVLSSIRRYQIAPLYPEDVKTMPAPPIPGAQVGLWQAQNPAFSSATNICSVSSPSASVVWIAGQDTSNSVAGHRLARSINGGMSWTQIAISGFANYTPSNIVALNKDTAWVSMYNSTGGGGVFRTNDGGLNWTQQTTASFAAPGGFPNFVHFTSATNGVCMGDPNGGYFEIYTTTNGGANWTRVAQSAIPANLPGEYGSVDKFTTSGSTIHFITNLGRIISSTNGGLTWNVNQPIINGDNTYVQWVSAKSATDAIAYLATTGYTKEYLVQTTNGGLNWQEIKNVTGYWGTYNKSAYAPLSGSEGVHVSLDQNNVRVSYNNGVAWAPQTELPQLNRGYYGAVAAAPDGTVWVSGQYRSSTSTGLYKLNKAAVDLVPIQAQFGGGKTACLFQDSMEVKLLNTGTSTINFSSTPLIITFNLVGKGIGDTAFNTTADFADTISSGLLAPGQVRVQKWTRGVINTQLFEIYMKASLNFPANSTGAEWNDVSGQSFTNGKLSTILADSVTGSPVSLTYTGSKVTLTCIGAFTSIQWQSQLPNDTNWVNEMGLGSNTPQYTVVATQTKNYRALVCGSILTNALALKVAQGNAVGYTYYNNQTNGSINNRIQYSGNKVTAVFTGSMDSTNTTTPDRGSFYNINAGSGWNPPTTSRFESFRTGFPSMAVTTNGKEIVVAHNGATGKLSLFRRNTIGSGAWTELIDILDGGWPRIVAGNGDTIHVIALSSFTNAGAAVKYYRSTNAGTSWDIGIDLPGYSVANGFATTSPETYAISAKGNVVSIAAGGYTNKLMIWKSTNSGANWSSQTVKTFPAGFDGNTITPQTETTDGSVSITIDNTNKVHLFTGRMFLQDDIAGDNDWSYFPSTDGLMHWKEGWPTDSLVLIASATATGNYNTTIHQTGTVGLCTFPASTVDRNSGALFLTFNVPMDNTADGITSVNRYDVFGMMSKNGGLNWSAPQNLTQSAAIGLESGFASIISNSSNKVHMLWQSSTTPVATNDGRINRKTILHEAIDYNRFASITQYQIGQSQFCGGDSVDVSYLAIGDFATVSVQLSDASGSFANPTILGNLANTNQPTTQRVRIPNNLANGVYSIRVVSNTNIESQASQTIAINKAPNKPLIVNTRPLVFCSGDSTVLKVDTTQIGIHNHFWYINGVEQLSWFNNLQVTISATSNVQVLSDNNGCAAWSDTIRITRNNNQAISANITPDTLACLGSVLTLKAIIVSGTPTSYQWKKGSIVVGSNSPNLVLGTVNNTVAGGYTITINSQCAAFVSDTINVGINTPPAIITQPNDVITCDGSNAIFEINASSLSAISYKWKRNNVVVGTDATLIVLNAAITDTGEYTCLVGNSCGNIVSQVAKLTLSEALSINSVLTDTSVCKGNILELSINVSGSDIDYTWYKDTAIVSNNSALLFNNIALNDSGNYFVEVSNSCGSLVSNIATVSVNDAALVSIEQVSGDTLRANISGTYTSINWSVNDSLIDGASDTILVARKSGNYVANVFSGNNCQNTSEPFPYFITGLAKQNVIESITVYPNPANNILFVNGLKGMAVLRITDLLGKQLFIKETNIDNIQLDVSALLPGMYLVQIQTEAGFAVEKIHIQR
jgi:hypothetical protein